MNSLLKIPVLLFSLAIPILFNSCIKEEFDPKKLDIEFVINPGVAAPLGYIHYELSEMLEDSARSREIAVDENGIISLVYEADVLSQQASELMQFSEIIHTGSIMNNSKYDLDLGLINYSYNLSQTDTIDLILSGPDGPIDTRIDSIQVDSLIINVNRSSSYLLRGKLIIKSLKIRKKFGNKWAYWAAAVPVLGPTQTVTVEDVTIILSHDPPDVNIVPVIFELRLDQSRGIVPAGYSILNYSMITTDLSYKAIYGYLGKMNFRTSPQEIPVDFYTSGNDGTFHFEQPQLKFYFENSFGMPIQILTTDLYATSISGTHIDINDGPGLPSEENVQIINYTTLEDFGKSAFDSLTISQDDADISRALDSLPASITFGIEARTNPLENDSDNFVTGKSQLNVKAKLILPLYGYTELMVLEDSMRFEFNDFFQNPPEEIKRMALRLNFTNGFPVDISTQVYFKDENYDIVDSVFDERYLIKAGTDINGDGRVEPLKNDPVEVEVTRTKIDNITRSRYIFINGRLNTANYEIPESFRFYSYYFLDAYIGVVGDLELNSTGN